MAKRADSGALEEVEPALVPGAAAAALRGVTRSFGGTVAVRDVSLELHAGHVLALLGENGAGKSTCVKLLAGVHRPNTGEVLLAGEPVQLHAPLDAQRRGVAVMHQHPGLFPDLAVEENLLIGHEQGMLDRAAMRREAVRLLELVGLACRPDTPLRELRSSEQQLVEIARALHAKSKILVLDEPTTALSSRETERLFALIRQLRSEGIALVYISHRMAEVYELSDRVSVLRDGAYVGTLDREGLTADALVKMMVGRDLSSFYTKEHDPHGSRGPVILEVKGITDGGRRVKPASFQLHQGEVLGIAGLVGSGRTELARLIYGADPKAAGEVLLDGQEVRITRPKEALDRGLAYLTEDRKALGLFLDMSCGENINVGVIDRDARAWGVLNLASAARRSAEAFKALRVRAASPLVTVGSLSGGNQQKVLLSRWLEIGPKVLILDEPTRGVDIGAKSEIYRIIDDLAKKGIGVVVISSELPEIIGTCDRVLVMREGQIEGEVGGPGGKPITQENIMALAAGVAA
mgnify:CR=1 FL=1